MNETKNAYTTVGTGRSRGVSLRTSFALAMLAFVIGAVLVTYAVTRWEPARRLIAPASLAPSEPQRAVSSSPAIEALPAAPVAGPPDAIIDTRVAGLEARLAQIDARANQASANAARAEGLLIAFAARRTIDRGAALGYLEGQLRARFAATQPRAVAAIIAAAQAPVTLDQLRQRLDLIAPELAGGGKGESWWDATRRTLAGLVVVRRADAPSPAPDERLLRARTDLSAGEADKALAEIARLPGSNASGGWMILARRYIEAHRALDILEASALTSGSPNLAMTGTHG